jgi:hypothetical protein
VTLAASLTAELNTLWQPLRPINTGLQRTQWKLLASPSTHLTSDVYDEQVFVQNPQEIGYTKKWKILKIILAIPFTISFIIGIVQSCEERFELG